MNNLELDECLRKNRKLIQLMEQNNRIPSSSFSGNTAEVLKRQRRMQMTRLETIQSKLKTLKKM